MSDWIAKHTNGSLKPKITLRDREVLSIINTVYADGRWKDPFEEQSTGNGTFHGEAGDAQVPMMHRTFSQMAYGHDEYNTWQRVEIPFDNGGNLAIVLPAEGHFDELAGDARSSVGRSVHARRLPLARAQWVAPRTVCPDGASPSTRSW